MWSQLTATYQEESSYMRAHLESARQRLQRVRESLQPRASEREATTTNHHEQHLHLEQPNDAHQQRQPQEPSHQEQEQQQRGRPGQQQQESAPDRPTGGSVPPTTGGPGHQPDGRGAGSGDPDEPNDRAIPGPPHVTAERLCRTEGCDCARATADKCPVISCTAPFTDMEGQARHCIHAHSTVDFQSCCLHAMRMARCAACALIYRALTGHTCRARPTQRPMAPSEDDTAARGCHTDGCNCARVNASAGIGLFSCPVQGCANKFHSLGEVRGHSSTTHLRRFQPCCLSQLFGLQCKKCGAVYASTEAHICTQQQDQGSNTPRVTRRRSSGANAAGAGPEAGLHTPPRQSHKPPPSKASPSPHTSKPDKPSRKSDPGHRPATTTDRAAQGPDVDGGHDSDDGNRPGSPARECHSEGCNCTVIAKQTSTPGTNKRQHQCSVAGCERIFATRNQLWSHLHVSHPGKADSIQPCCVRAMGLYRCPDCSVLLCTRSRHDQACPAKTRNADTGGPGGEGDGGAPHSQPLFSPSEAMSAWERAAVLMRDIHWSAIITPNCSTSSRVPTSASFRERISLLIEAGTSTSGRPDADEGHKKLLLALPKLLFSKGSLDRVSQVKNSDICSRMAKLVAGRLEDTDTYQWLAAQERVPDMAPPVPPPDDRHPAPQPTGEHTSQASARQRPPSPQNTPSRKHQGGGDNADLPRPATNWSPFKDERHPPHRPQDAPMVDEDKDGPAIPREAFIAAYDQASHLVTQGELSRAWAVLEGVASIGHLCDPAVLKQMRDLHPGPRSAIPAEAFATAIQAQRAAAQHSFSVQHLHEAIRTAPRAAAPGGTGWRREHLIHATLYSKSADKVLAQLASVLRAMEDNSFLPAEAQVFFAGGVLTALTKPDGSYRPIAVGELFRRLLGRAIALHNAPAFAKFFQPRGQMGVATPGGIESIVHSVRLALHKDPNLVCISLDFSNAFNSVDRGLIYQQLLKHFPSLVPYFLAHYGHPSQLRERGDASGAVVWSLSGTQQGDPLAPFFFALALDAIREGAPAPEDGSIFLDLAYLDDIHLVATPAAAAARLAFYAKRLATLDSGLQFKRSKCTAWSPGRHPDSLQPLLQDTYDRIPGAPGLDFTWFRLPPREHGLKVLGSFVGTAAYTKANSLYRAERIARTLERLKDLPNLHIAVILLIWCGVAKINHFLRSTPPSLIRSAAVEYDNRVLHCLRDLQDLATPSETDHPELFQQWARGLRLPFRKGGMALTSGAALRHIAYAASVADTARLLASLEPATSPFHTITQPLAEWLGGQGSFSGMHDTAAPGRLRWLSRTPHGGQHCHHIRPPRRQPYPGVPPGPWQLWFRRPTYRQTLQTPNSLFGASKGPA